MTIVKNIPLGALPPEKSVSSSNCTKLTHVGFLSIAAPNTNLLDSAGTGIGLDVRNYQSGKLFVVSPSAGGSYTIQGAVDQAFSVGVHTIQVFDSTGTTVSPITGTIAVTATTRVFDINLQGINYIRVNMTVGGANVRPTIVLNQASFVSLLNNASVASLPTLASVTTVATVTTVGNITNLGISTSSPTLFTNGSIGVSPTTVKALSGKIYGMNIINPNATDVYLKIFNALVGSVTVGTTIPLRRFLIKGNSSLYIPTQLIAVCNCSVAITIAATTGLLAGDATAPTFFSNVEIDFI